MEIYCEQVARRAQTAALLKTFRVSALRGDIRCYAQNRDSLKLRPIEAQAWRIGEEVLWSR